MCSNGTLSCVDFMDITMGDLLLFPNVSTAYTGIIFSPMLHTGIYMCISKPHCLWMGRQFHVLISWMLSWEIYHYFPMLTPSILFNINMLYITYTALFEWDTFMCWFHGCYHGSLPWNPHVEECPIWPLDPKQRRTFSHCECWWCRRETSDRKLDSTLATVRVLAVQSATPNQYAPPTHYSDPSWVV